MQRLLLLSSGLDLMTNLQYLCSEGPGCAWSHGTCVPTNVCKAKQVLIVCVPHSKHIIIGAHDSL